MTTFVEKEFLGHKIMGAISNVQQYGRGGRDRKRMTTERQWWTDWNGGTLTTNLLPDMKRALRDGVDDPSRFKGEVFVTGISAIRAVVGDEADPVVLVSDGRDVRYGIPRSNYAVMLSELDPARAGNSVDEDTLREWSHTVRYWIAHPDMKYAHRLTEPVEFIPTVDELRDFRY